MYEHEPLLQWHQECWIVQIAKGKGSEYARVIARGECDECGTWTGTEGYAAVIGEDSEERGIVAVVVVPSMLLWRWPLSFPLHWPNLKEA